MPVVYHRLHLRCPACVGTAARLSPATYWYHGDCGGPLELGSDATVRCAWCRHTSHVRHWRYSCGDHHGDYRSTTSAQFAASMSMSAALVSAGGRQWLINILNDLLDW